MDELNQYYNSKISPEKMFLGYKELFPNELELLVIYNLYISKSESTENFEYSEIKQSILDSSKLPFLNLGTQIQVERVFKKLLGAFIERIPGNFNQFVLTPHAERIIEIIVHRIKNPYLQFPLKETFETYFQLPENAENDISLLQRWYKLGFQNTARQVVIGHLEGLKIAVDQAIKELNQVLEADDLTAIQMLEKFAFNFRILGEKAKQINEALRVKEDVYYSLRAIVETFIQKTDSYKHPNTTFEQIAYSNLEKERESARYIKEEVFIFFDKVDKQLSLINARLTFASYKITELQESLRAQSHYKINLKKILSFLLENSSSDKNGIKLPNGFPAKDIVQQKFRFRPIRYWDRGFLLRGKPFEQESDQLYEQEERNKLELELAQQKLIYELCEKAQKDLSESGTLNLSSRLFEIMEAENNIEVVVETGYELMRAISKTTQINIKEELQSDKNNTIHTWKVILQNKPNLNS